LLRALRTPAPNTGSLFTGKSPTVDPSAHHPATSDASIILRYFDNPMAAEKIMVDKYQIFKCAGANLKNEFSAVFFSF
jgi:hypothetical protein